MSDFRSVRFFQLGQLAADIQTIIFDIPLTTPEILVQFRTFSARLEALTDQIRSYYILHLDSFADSLQQLYDDVYILRSRVFQ